MQHVVMTSRQQVRISFPLSTVKKNEFVHQPASEKPHKVTNMVGLDRLRSVESFTDLRSILPVAAAADDEINKGLAKTYSAFGKLRKMSEMEVF